MGRVPCGYGPKPAGIGSRILNRFASAVRCGARLAENFLEPPAIVLSYHRIAKLPRDVHRLAVPPEVFRAQLRMLKKKCRVLTPEEFSSRKKSGRPFPPRSVLITFDDGYADCLHHAAPILEEEGLRALFFVATGVSPSGYWWDRLEEACPDEREHWKLYRELKFSRPAEREAQLGELLGRKGLSATVPETHRTLTGEEIAALARSTAARIGSHGHTHSPFSILGPSEVRNELVESVRILKERTGTAPREFSYPYGGREEVGTAAEALLPEAGFELGFVHEYGQVCSKTRGYCIPRIPMLAWDAAAFRRRLMRFFLF